MKKTRLKMRGTSETSVLKERIQFLVRAVVIKRDKGCILRSVRHCGGDLDTEGVVIQADHILTRSNSATYADTRLIVCICKSCHGFKHWNKEECDALYKKILSKETVELWEKCEKDSWRPQRTGSADWRLSIVILEKELAEYEKEN